MDGGRRADGGLDTLPSEWPLTPTLPNEEAVRGEVFAREHRAKRELITAHLPLRGMPIAPDMRAISALNLEPAVPKLDAKTWGDWLNFKLQSRTSSQASDLKAQFRQSLEVFKMRAVAKSLPEEEAPEAPEAQPLPRRARGRPVASSDSAATASSMHRAVASNAEAYPQDAGRQKRPSGRGSGGEPSRAQGGAAEESRAGGARPAVANDAALSPKPRSPPAHDFLGTLLEPFYRQALREQPGQCSPEWPGRCGASYREVMGVPQPALVQAIAHGSAQAAAGAPYQAPHRQQQQQAQWQGQQMQQLQQQQQQHQQQQPQQQLQPQQPSAWQGQQVQHLQQQEQQQHQHQQQPPPQQQQQWGYACGHAQAPPSAAQAASMLPGLAFAATAPVDASPQRHMQMHPVVAGVAPHRGGHGEDMASQMGQASPGFGVHGPRAEQPLQTMAVMPVGEVHGSLLLGGPMVAFAQGIAGYGQLPQGVVAPQQAAQAGAGQFAQPSQVGAGGGNFHPAGSMMQQLPRHR